MHIIVVGAGVVGVTTAWYLRNEGHEVTVIERDKGPARQTSFGNAGGVCPSFAGPWAAPGMPLKALRWMFQASAPLLLRPKLDPAQWRWLWQFMLNCSSQRFAENKARMQEMAHYSLRCLQALRAETGIDYDHGEKGVLQVFATADELAGGERAAAVLDSLDIPHKLVNAQEANQIEPALANSGATIVGGLHLPADETGDSYLFTQRLADLASANGVRFVFDTEVNNLIMDAQGQLAGVQTGHGPEYADACVLACGPYVAPLLARAKFRLPVYPVKGYSMTWRVTDDSRAPRSSLMDEHSKVMITRLGDRIRAAGMAEVTGYDTRLRAPALQSLSQRTAELFPGAADYDEGRAWCGFRPMTPSGPALVGPTRIPGLYLNAGHGSNGWTQACGTSRSLADLICGKEPEVSLTTVTL